MFQKGLTVAKWVKNGPKEQSMEAREKKEEAKVKE